MKIALKSFFLNKNKTDTCIRVLASSMGEQAMQANERAIEPATSGAYGVNLGALCVVNSSIQLRKMS